MNISYTYMFVHEHTKGIAVIFYILICQSDEYILKSKEAKTLNSSYLYIDKTPSEASFTFILDKVPVWQKLVVCLGVPLDQVQSLQVDTIMGGFMALKLWQSGRYATKGFPPTWQILLKAVEDCNGPRISNKIAERAAVEETWSIQ